MKHFDPDKDQLFKKTGDVVVDFVIKQVIFHYFLFITFMISSIYYFWYFIINGVVFYNLYFIISPFIIYIITIIVYIVLESYVESKFVSDHTEYFGDSFYIKQYKYTEELNNKNKTK